MNKTQRPCIRDQRLFRENYVALLESPYLYSLPKVLFNPVKIFVSQGRKSFFQEKLMFGSYLKWINEFFDLLKAGKDAILSGKGKLSKEYLEGSLLLMLRGLVIGIGAGELIKIIVEKVYGWVNIVHTCLKLKSSLFYHYIYRIILSNFDEDMP